MVAWRGRLLAEMSQAELITALREVWRSYMAVNRRTMSAATLALPPDTDVEALEDTLALWFGPKET